MIAFSLTISQSQIAATTRHNVTEQLRRNTRQPAIIFFRLAGATRGRRDAEDEDNVISGIATLERNEFEEIEL